MRSTWVSGYRVLFALFALVAIGYQFYDSTIEGDFSPFNFFSFFTIQSNLIGAAVFLSLAFALDNDQQRSPRLELVRGAATLYLFIAFVVYGLLLSGYQEELQTTTPWVDTVLHRWMPLVVVADWLLDPPHHRIELRRALVWLAYTLLYAAYSLIRGPIVDWYPYPFLDPDSAGGYLVVALSCLAIAVGTVVGAWLVVLLSRRVRLAVSAVT